MKPVGVIAVLIVLGAACDDGTDAGGIDRAEFVAAFVDLREATVVGTLDSTRRDSILAAHEVTEAELRAYIEARSSDPAALADTWREVMDSVAARDSASLATDSASAEPDTF